MKEEIKQARFKLTKLIEQQDFNNELYLNDSDIDEDIRQIRQDIAVMESKEV